MTTAGSARWLDRFPGWFREPGTLLSRPPVVVGAAAVLLAVMLGLVPDYGATWDERFQQKYGEQTWDYLHGRLPRSAFDTHPGNQHLYGALVEVAAVAAQRALPEADIYVVRHGVTAWFGWLGLVACGLTAGRLVGPGAGWLAAALLLLTPRYLGHAMNNPKDVPFAALSAVAVFIVVTAGDVLPFLSWRRAAALGAAVAMAINVRPLGVALVLFALAVLALRAGLALARAPRGRRPWGQALRLCGRLLLAGGMAVPVGTVFWPWAQGAPFTRPIEAFLVSSRAAWAADLVTVLHGGRTLTPGELPWYYVPEWLAVGFPPVLLLGALLAPLAWRRSGAAGRRGLTAVAAFFAAPVIMAVVRGATLYDDIRHLYFILPPLAVLAAAGWTGLLGVPRRGVASLGAAALVVGLAEPLAFSVRNHPHQSVYFSPLAGGPAAAFGRYEMDYWGNSCLQGVRWAAEQAARARMPLAVCGRPGEVVEADVGRFHALTYARRPADPCHLFVGVLRGRRDEILASVDHPSVVHRVTLRDGTLLSVVSAGAQYRQLHDRLRDLGRSADVK